MKTNSTIFNFLKPFSMLKWLGVVFTLTVMSEQANAQVAINTDNSAPAASAMLDVKATGLGFLAPRMTFAQRPAAPATGLIIYQTDSDPGYYYYDGGAWQKVGKAGSDFWLANGSDIYFSTGKVSVGTIASDDHGINSINYIAAKGGVRGVNQFATFLYSDGQLGVLNFPANPLALPIDVANIGVFGVKPNTGANGAAVYGWNVDADDANYGGIFATEGATAGINYGTYSIARNGGTNYGGTFITDGVSTGANYGIYSQASTSGTNYGIYSEAFNGAANIAGFFKGRVEVEANSSGSDIYSPVFRSAVTHNLSADTYAVEGVSVPTPGYGIAVKGEGGYMGAYGHANATTYTGAAYGVYGYATGTAGTRYGVYGYASTTGTAIGVYGFGSGTTASWAGYFSGDVYVSSDVRIGTTVAATGYSLSVDGKIACEEVLIDDSGFWPDYVFGEDYDLMSIDEFEQSINENNHLPGMPSAKDIEENGGHHIGEIQKKTLEKVEELSLYIIELNNRMKALEQENKELKAQVSNQ